MNIQTTENLDGILEQIAFCVENGKINQRSPYPPAMKGQLGADELTLQALGEGMPDARIAKCPDGYVGKS